MPTDGADSAGTADFQAALLRMGLASPGEVPRLTPLTGGVSSDIVRADLASGPVCIKRALPKLKVKANWEAPVERNRWEVEWMRTAGAIVPGAVPRVLGEDAAAGMFVMEYLAPEQHPVWKTQLRDGAVDPSFAAQVGHLIASIHAHTALRGNRAERGRGMADRAPRPALALRHAPGRSHRPDPRPRLTPRGRARLG